MREGLRRRKRAQLGDVRLADEDKPRLAELGREIAVPRRDPGEVAQEGHPRVVGVAGRLAEEVFEQKGDSTKRPVG
jgi:hypothetical protein